MPAIRQKAGRGRPTTGPYSRDGAVRDKSGRRDGGGAGEGAESSADAASSKVTCTAHTVYVARCPAPSGGGHSLNVRLPKLAREASARERWSLKRPH